MTIDEPRRDGPPSMFPSRPDHPGYGLLPADEGSGLMHWPLVEQQLKNARNYWVVTVTRGNRPHAVPVWGAWVDGRFYFGSERRSKKSRNLSHNSSVILHLESGDEVVIAEGEAVEVEDQSNMEAVDAEYLRKYGLRLSGGLVYEATFSRVFAWKEEDYPGSATRWQREKADSAGSDDT